MVEFISDKVNNSGHDISQQTVERIKNLWDWRITELESENSLNKSLHELKAYGSWFQLNCFSHIWVLDQLYKTLKLGKDVRDWSGVCNKLTSLSHNFPTETAKCVRLLTESKSPWYLSSTSILGNVIISIIASHNQDAINIVNEAVDHLLARGFSGYESSIDAPK